MQVRIRVMASIQCGVLLLGSLSEAQAEDKLKKDRRHMAASVGVMAASTGAMAAGVFTLNPLAFELGLVGFGAGTGGLGRSAIEHRIHRKQAEREQAAASVGPVESLVLVPGRPGYFYYPSNPNQLYFDPAQVSDPMQAQIVPPVAPVVERISVRIANPSKVGRAIDCTVDGAPFSIPSGMVLSVTATRQAVISYDRGDRPEPDRYTLDEGDYEFRTVDNGRGLYRLKQPLAVATVPSDAKTPAQGASVPR
jgi:hypothetical protein